MVRYEIISILRLNHIQITIKVVLLLTDRGSMYMWIYFVIVDSTSKMSSAPSLKHHQPTKAAHLIQNKSRNNSLKRFLHPSKQVIPLPPNLEIIQNKQLAST